MMVIAFAAANQRKVFERDSFIINLITAPSSIVFVSIAKMYDTNQ